ncbi:MAG: CehA/McbA family metallohydrolase [Saccharofermentanales bacterium]
MITIRRTAIHRDGLYHTCSGTLSGYDSLAPGCGSWVARMCVPAGMQAYFELFDFKERLTLQLVRYKPGKGRWVSMNTRIDDTVTGDGDCFWVMALRNISDLIFEEFKPLEAIVEIRGREHIIADEHGKPKRDAQRPDKDGLYWIPGDLHQHSADSDGMLEPEMLFSLNRDNGMEFMALTDHQVYHPGEAGAIPIRLGGLEATTPSGHLNCIGLDHWGGLAMDSISADDFGGGDWLRAKATGWKQSGAAVIINHPCFPPWHWRWDNLDSPWFDALEILCDPGHPGSSAASEAALALWNDLLSRGWPITGTGGSDFHESPGTPGYPTTFLGCEHPFPAASDLLDAIRSGRMSVGCGYRPSLKVRQAMDGKMLWWEPKAEKAAGKPHRITDTDAAVDCSLVVCGETAAMCRIQLDGPERRELALPLPLADKCLEGRTKIWIRMDCRNAAGELTGFTNPIWMDISRAETTTEI